MPQQQTSVSVIQSAQLMSDRGIPLWRYMMTIQFVLALFPTVLLGSLGGYVPVFLVSFAVSWLIWGIGIPVLILRISGNKVATQICQDTRTAL